MRILTPLLLAAALAIVPASAKDHRPRSTNPNVKRAQKKARKSKYKPAKYKAPKKTRRPAHA